MQGLVFPVFYDPHARSCMAAGTITDIFGRVIKLTEPVAVDTNEG
jgi:hypothetical protein